MARRLIARAREHLGEGLVAIGFFGTWLGFTLGFVELFGARHVWPFAIGVLCIWFAGWDTLRLIGRFGLGTLSKTAKRGRG